MRHLKEHFLHLNFCKIRKNLKEQLWNITELGYAGGAFLPFGPSCQLPYSLRNWWEGGLSLCAALFSAVHHSGTQPHPLEGTYRQANSNLSDNAPRIGDKAMAWCLSCYPLKQ